MTAHSPRHWQLTVAELDPCGYTLNVAATDAADAVQGAGGLIFDRIREGWTVRVFAIEELDPQPLRILGAQGLTYDATTALTPSRPRIPLALSAATLNHSDGMYREVLSQLRRGAAEITLWGEPPTELQQHVVTMEHRLTAAARAFKRRAHAACGLQAAPVHVERFHGTGTLCVPGNPDLTPVSVAAV
jgi:hypothetical protein